MTTEDAEFEGWTYDRTAERAYVPARLGLLGKRLFWGCFWALVVAASADWLAGAWAPKASVSLLPRWLAAWGLGGLGVGIVLGLIAEALRRRSAPACSRCGQPMALIETLPSPSESQTRGYRVGPSGHAYVEDGEHTREVRKQWYGCRACRRHFLFDGKALLPVADMESQERDIALAERTIRGAVARQRKRASGPRGRPQPHR